MCTWNPAGKYYSLPATSTTNSLGLPNIPLSRLRVVTSSAFGVFQLTIEKHLMSIIMNGPAVIQPTSLVSSLVSSLVVNVGERHDVVICRIPDSTPANSPVFIQMTMNAAVFDTISSYPNTTAILRYQGGAQIPNRDASSGQTTLNYALNVGDELNGPSYGMPAMSPLPPLTTPSFLSTPATRKFTMTLAFGSTTNFDSSLLPGTVNGQASVLPTFAINGAAPVNFEYPPILQTQSLYDLWVAKKPFPTLASGSTNYWGVNSMNISQGDVVVSAIQMDLTSDRVLYSHLLCRTSSLITMILVSTRCTSMDMTSM